MFPGHDSYSRLDNFAGDGAETASCLAGWVNLEQISGIVCVLSASAALTRKRL